MSVFSSNQRARQVAWVRYRAIEELLSGFPRGLTVTCGEEWQRAAILRLTLARSIEAGLPAVILYSGEAFAHQLAQFRGVDHVSVGQPHYEPLLGMREEETLHILKEQSSGRTSGNAGEDTVIKAYLHLLTELGYPLSLTHLLWLIHMEKEQLRQVLETAGRGAQMERFEPWFTVREGQSVSLRELVQERLGELGNAVMGLWTDDGSYSDISILRTLERRGVLAIRVDQGRGDAPAVNYLARELEFAATRGIPFLLACCELVLPKSCVLSGRLSAAGNAVCFVSGRHLPLTYPDGNWLDMSGACGELLLLNCNAAGTAQAYVELFGSYCEQVESFSKTSIHQPFRLFGARSSGCTISDRYADRFLVTQLSDHQQGGIFCSGDGGVTLIDDLGLDRYLSERGGRS